MINSVSNSVQALSAAQTKPLDVTLAKSKLQAPKDTVQVSSAAQTALQEATETHEQTVKEAMSGDLQAKSLLAREAAAKAAGQ